MNTKGSVVIGWVAYTVAFSIGGYYGYQRYYNSPGGRKEREVEADRIRAEQEEEERQYEERVRLERAQRKIEFARNASASKNASGSESSNEVAS